MTRPAMPSIPDPRGLEARLRQDALAQRSAPSAQRSARVIAAVRAQGSGPATRRVPRWRLVAAAALAVAVGATLARVVETPRPPRSLAVRATAERVALWSGRARLLARDSSDAVRRLDVALLTELEAVKSDADRAARAFVASLPPPLRSLAR